MRREEPAKPSLHALRARPAHPSAPACCLPALCAVPPQLFLELATHWRAIPVPAGRWMRREELAKNLLLLARAPGPAGEPTALLWRRCPAAQKARRGRNPTPPGEAGASAAPAAGAAGPVPVGAPDAGVHFPSPSCPPPPPRDGLSHLLLRAGTRPPRPATPGGRACWGANHRRVRQGRGRLTPGPTAPAPPRRRRRPVRPTREPPSPRGGAERWRRSWRRWWRRG